MNVLRLPVITGFKSNIMLYRCFWFLIWQKILHHWPALLMVSMVKAKCDSCYPVLQLSCWQCCCMKQMPPAVCNCTVHCRSLDFLSKMTVGVVGKWCNWCNTWNTNYSASRVQGLKDFMRKKNTFSQSNPCCLHCFDKHENMKLKLGLSKNLFNFLVWYRVLISCLRVRKKNLH